MICKSFNNQSFYRVINKLFKTLLYPSGLFSVENIISLSMKICWFYVPVYGKRD
jgi:hypothetical protein